MEAPDSRHRCQRGEKATVDAFIAEHPDLAGRILPPMSSKARMRDDGNYDFAFVDAVTITIICPTT